MALPHLPSGLLLKIAMGATTVTAAVAGAGAVGALPGPAQAVFTASVEAVTPFQVGGDDGTEQIDDEVTIPTTTLPEDEQDAPTTLPDDDATDDGIDDATDDATDDTTDDGIDDAVDDGTSDDSDDADGTDDSLHDGTGSTYDPELHPNFGAWVTEQARQGGVDGREISAAAHAKNAARKAERAGTDTDDAADADAKDRGGRGNGANKANDKAKKGKGPKHDR